VDDPDVDVVYVASPHSDHHTQAQLALDAGKPVLVEKAFTRNAAEARELIDLARSRGLFLGASATPPADPRLAPQRRRSAGRAQATFFTEAS
jgi:predicted dehydrogenase